jgi:hypothetical protein
VQLWQGGDPLEMAMQQRFGWGPKSVQRVLLFQSLFLSEFFLHCVITENQRTLSVHTSSSAPQGVFLPKIENCREDPPTLHENAVLNIFSSDFLYCFVARFFLKRNGR